MTVNLPAEIPNENDDEMALTVTKIGELAPGHFGSIERAQIDSLIEHAQNNPRRTDKSRREMLELVTYDEEVAESMHYALPRTDRNGKRVFIEGPSIRLAEVVAYCWQNMRADGAVVGTDETH